MKALMEVSHTDRLEAIIFQKVIHLLVTEIKQVFQ